jgi:Holliday junction DNA helicase RuvA
VISRLRGAPAGRTLDGLVVDVGGVGYLVSATPSVLRRAEGATELNVETYLHVREDTLQLYGFADGAERALFVRLLGVSGVGPKVALAVVSSASPDELQRAIALKDSARFQAIPGIGKKTAERIVLELKERFAQLVAPAGGGIAISPSEDDRLRDDLLSALQNLGYHRPLAEKAVDAIVTGSPAQTFEAALKAALRELMR